MDNLKCPADGRVMDFLGYATYYDGRYEVWECSCGKQIAKKVEL